jgi:heme-degrading monooxygenase HmoA
MPLVQGMDGCVGLSMLADRESGRSIVTTSWASADAMRASAERVRQVRDRAAEVAGGAAEVQEWEIAIMHRRQETREGARTRVIWSDTDPGLDQMVDNFRTTMLPRVEELPGFCSANMMIDRQNNRSVLAVTYEDRQAMERAGDQAAALRREADEKLGMHITEVAEFDLVLAHLRVPETV